MIDRVNWQMEHVVHTWILRQENIAEEKRSGAHSPILDLAATRDEIVRNILTEIEEHDGPFGASKTPESIL